ncbi:MAG: GntR family transcriptional regulator [Chloroflexota bacterium]
MSQSQKALMGIRELILNGELPIDKRLSEMALVERLGVSRTPIRSALVKLSEEGLLEKTSGGSYKVRLFSLQDVQDAIELRGTIEGLAARLAAERGVAAGELAALKATTDKIDALLGTTTYHLSTDNVSTYAKLNGEFHQQLIKLAHSFVIAHQLERIISLPFASPDAMVSGLPDGGKRWERVYSAQEQHKAIVEAIGLRQGTRAEFLTREHSRISLNSVQNFLGQNGRFRLDDPTTNA